MRTQSPDTSPEAERYLIELIRQAPLPKRFRMVQSLSQRMLSGHDPAQDVREETILSITCGYGRQMGQRVRGMLAEHPDWKEHPVDLSATLVPVMQALERVGISSYIGGSIASSLHGMLQSARDIDLVLPAPKKSPLPIPVALAALQDQYHIDQEEVSQALYKSTRLSLLHLNTLMKVDLIFAQTPGFDEAMLPRVSPLLIDERYAPLPVASALEMAVWKLARCAKELVASGDGLMDDAEWNDLLGILKVQGPAFDVAQFTSWAHTLGIGHLFAQALSDAGLSPIEETSHHLLAG